MFVVSKSSGLNITMWISKFVLAKKQRYRSVLTSLPCFAMHPFEPNVTTAHLQYLDRKSNAASGSTFGPPLKNNQIAIHDHVSLFLTLCLLDMITLLVNK